MEKYYEAEICKFKSKKITDYNTLRYEIDEESLKNIVGSIEDDMFIDSFTEEKYHIIKKDGQYISNLETIEIGSYYARNVKSVTKRKALLYYLRNAKKSMKQKQKIKQK